MKPIDWLRGKAKRETKPAPGGIVTATWQPSGGVGCTLTVDNSESRFTPADNARPIGFIEFDGVMTDDQVQQIRNSIQVYARPRASETRTSNTAVCGCWPRYSECRCAPRAAIGA